MRVVSRRVLCTLALAAAFGVASAAPANAQAIISNGTVALGVDALGQLNVADGTGGVRLTPTNSGSIGLYSHVIDGDATAPGCLCEGFGVSVNGTTSGWANNNLGGGHNLTPVSFASTADTATTVAGVTSLPGLTVTHAYSPSLAPELYQAVVTITNNTGGALTDLRYNRTMDWDIPPTTFTELVTLQGAGAGDLIDSCNNGFETSDPLVTCRQFGAGGGVVPFFHNVNFIDQPPGGTDHGARFTFGFGDLADGASKTFTIFYGAAEGELAALAALALVGAEGIYSFGQPSSAGGAEGFPITFIFGFEGVGAPPIVPEPGTLALLAMGLAATAGRRLRRR